MEIDISKLNKIHIIGICSNFGSFVAEYLLSKGIEITGSDMNHESQNAYKWKNAGILVDPSDDLSYINNSLDLVAIPNAPTPDNLEINRAIQLGIKIVKTNQLFGEISKNFEVISVSGTAGKSSVTSMTAWCIYQLEEMPNFVFGTHEDILKSFDKAYNLNLKSKYLVVESCEYRDQFLDRIPKAAHSILTSVSFDHTDYFKSQKQYNKSFAKLLKRTTQNIVYSNDSQNTLKIIKSVKNTKNKTVCFHNTSRVKYDFKFENEHLNLSHNFENSYKVILLLEKIGFNKNKILSSISKFPGISRRTEFIGNYLKMYPLYLERTPEVVKIKKSIGSIKEKYKDKKVIIALRFAAFQRIYDFQSEYLSIFNDIDNTIILDNVLSPIQIESTKQQNLININQVIDNYKLLYNKENIYLEKDLDNIFHRIDDIINADNSEFLLIFYLFPNDFSKYLTK